MYEYHAEANLLEPIELLFAYRYPCRFIPPLYNVSAKHIMSSLVSVRWEAVFSMIEQTHYSSPLM